MKTYFNKNKTLTWVLAFLFVVNIAALGTIFFHMYRSPNNYPTAVQQFETGRRAPGNGRFLRDALNFNDDQFNRFITLRHSFQTEAAGIFSKIHALRTEIFDELAKDNPDMKVISNLSRELGNYHTELQNATNRYYLDIKQLCNNEQKAKLNDFFFEMLNRHEPMQMHRGRHGRQFHRRTNTNTNRNLK